MRSRIHEFCFALIATLPLSVRAEPNVGSDDSFHPTARQQSDARLTISAVQDGAVDILIRLETIEELPLQVEAVSVTLAIQARTSSR